MDMQASKFLFRGVAGAVAGFALALSAQAATLTTQLGFLVDRSGSIGATNFGIMKTGYANALGALPTDGSVEVTIYSFGSSATEVVAPTVVTGATLPGIVAAVNAMAYPAGQATFTAAGIEAISNAMLASSNYLPALRSIVNMATDGAPNDTSGNPQQNAIDKATAARAAGIDALDAEAIGTNATTLGQLRDIVFSPLTGPCADCGDLLANGSTPPNPMTSNPWVLQVDNFAGFETAIKAKIEAAVNVPEPNALALVGIAVAGLGVASRRRAR